MEKQGRGENAEAGGPVLPAGALTVVSGLPRSGTSMMMRMLEAAGLPVLTDGVRQPDVDNPNGYYELERVKALAEGDAGWIEDARGRVVKVVSPLLACLPETEQYRVVVMRRDFGEVLASQRRMLVRRGEPVRDMDDRRLGEIYAESLCQVEGWASRSPNVRALFLDYGEVLRDPLGALAATRELLGEDLDLAAMAAVVDQALYRNRSFGAG